MVGGGGLIQLPALFILLPGVTVPTVLGTNKLVSIAGTSVAARQYARHVRLDWPTLAPAAGAAFVCSGLGARAVTLVHTSLLRPAILVLLVVVAVYVFWQKDFGAIHAPKLSPKVRHWAGVGLGGVLGFYDGFFGPGTGSFLIFAFIGVFGFNFLTASASSKVVNAATNLAAVLLCCCSDGPATCCTRWLCRWPPATSAARCWEPGLQSPKAAALSASCFWSSCPALYYGLPGIRSSADPSAARVAISSAGCV